VESNVNKLSVCIIVPAYNASAYLAAALDSALNQTRKPHEIIVVDDGSTDETPEILRQYAAPVTVIRQSNQGLSAARNAALRQATGDAIMFLDADDLLLPNCIEDTISVLEQNPAVDVVYSDVRLIDQQGRELGVFSDLYPGERPCGHVLGELGYRWSVITVSSTTVRRSAMQDIEFDEGLSSSAEDFEMWRRLAARSQFQYLDAVTACYRHHAGQITAIRARATQEGAIEVQRRLMSMPEFEEESAHTKSKLYQHHGIRQAELGNLSKARSMFWRAVRVEPMAPLSYGLLALSCLGERVMNYVIAKRRQVVIGALSKVIMSVAALGAAVEVVAAQGENEVKAVAETEIEEDRTKASKRGRHD
jgi:hypothetical protein